MNLSVYFTGLTVGLSLIVAIGAQNAFVLRQGLRREHVLAVCLVCIVSDALLIALGVTSFGRLLDLLPWLDPAMRYAGAAFLAWFGVRSLLSAFRSSEGLGLGSVSAAPGRARTLLACLAITWLNPHVYLDTVVFLGTVSTRFAGSELSFALGAVSGSTVFFLSLGYGAAWLRPVFANPSAWRVLDTIIGVFMWAIALKLVAQI